MIPRFHCPLPLSADTSIELPESVAHHALQVLRMRVGDRLVLFDGEGGEYEAQLEGAGKRPCARVGRRRDVERESPLDVTLAQALPAGEKMDWIVQKAVELGVRRIVPVAAARSVLRLSGERAAKRLRHWRQVMIAACEQCGRTRLADVDAVTDLDEFLARCADSPATRLVLAPGGAGGLREVAARRPIVVLIGPEGGFTADELAAAASAGFGSVGLGPRVLRTETAGPAVLAALAALHGDF